MFLQAESQLSKHLTQLEKLRWSKKKLGVAPHKPMLLLAIIEVKQIKLPMLKINHCWRTLNGMEKRSIFPNLFKRVKLKQIN